MLQIDQSLEKFKQAERLFKSAGFEVGPCNRLLKRPDYKWKNENQRQGMTIERYVQERGTENLGICIFTGQGSKLTVIDVDNLERKSLAATGSLDAEFHKFLYEKVIAICESACAAVVETQNHGKHFYYSYTPALTNRANYITGIDVRNDGGLVITAPTIGENGVYKFTDKCDIHNLTPVPQELIDLLTEAAAKSSANGSAVKAADRTEQALIHDHEVIGIGQRDDRVFRHFCSCRERGIAKAVAVENLLQMNNIQFDAEWNHSKLYEKADRAYDFYQDDKPELPTHTAGGIDITKKAIEEIRASKLSIQQKNLAMTNSIIKYLEHAGALYFDLHTKAAYYFHTVHKQLCTVAKDDMLFKSMLYDLGINPQEKLFGFVTEAIYNRAYKGGRPIEIFRDMHFDEDTLSVYVYDHAHHFYKITPDDIMRAPLGTDGVLFLADHASEPFEFSMVSEGLSKFNEVLVDKIYFDDSSLLTVDEQRIMFRMFTLFYFFCTRDSDRPILVLVGDKGSTKSTHARRLGQVFKGSKFDVTPISKRKEDDFDVTLINSRFLVIDNVDQHIDWLYDKLAIMATGGTIRRKILYTTADIAEFPLDVYPVITTRTPNFCRDDVADRLLILHTKRPDSFINRKHFKKELLASRNQIMSELIVEAQRILTIMHTDPGDLEVDFRIADFASFCLRIARHDGYEAQMRTILRKMNREQSLFTLENEEGALFDLIMEWNSNVYNQQRFVTNKELWTELCELADHMKMEFEYRGKFRSFAQAIARLRVNLDEFFFIDEQSVGNRQKACRYVKK